MNVCIFSAGKKMGTNFTSDDPIGAKHQVGFRRGGSMGGKRQHWKASKGVYTALYMHFRVPDSQSKSEYIWELVGSIVFHVFVLLRARWQHVVNINHSHASRDLKEF